MWALTIEDEQGVITRVDLAGGAYSIGRDPACDICLVDRNVSRLHAALRARPEGDWELVDQDSLNGCFLNGRRVRERAIVAPADTLQVGDYHLHLVDGVTEAAGGARAPGKPDRLLVLEGSEAGRELRLDKGPLTIGGGVGCHLSLSDEALRFLVRPVGGGRYELINVGPRAELWVNFSPVWRKLLDDGDRIEVHGEVALRFLRGERSSLSDAPPSAGARASGPASLPPRSEGRPTPSAPLSRLSAPKSPPPAAPPPLPAAPPPLPAAPPPLPAAASKPLATPSSPLPPPVTASVPPPRVIITLPPTLAAAGQKATPPLSGGPPSKPGKELGAVNTLDGQVKGLRESQSDSAPISESLSKLSTTHGALTDDAFQYPTAPNSYTREPHPQPRRRKSARAAIAAAVAVVAVAPVVGWQMGAMGVGRSPRAEAMRSLPAAAPLSLSLQTRSASPPAASGSATPAPAGRAKPSNLPPDGLAPRKRTEAGR